MKMELTKPICIIIYEDNPDYAYSFKIRAQKDRILVDIVTNVDSLFELLEESYQKYKFIVLDARAFLHEGQSSGTESEANLIKIFSELKNLEHRFGKKIPCAINTGFADIKLTHQEVVPCPIFNKGNEIELIEHIKQQFLNSDVGQLFLALYNFEWVT
jgi:hypothetical protein